MSEQYPGGFISKNAPTVSTSSAQGMWTLSQQAGYQKQGLWPSPPFSSFTAGTQANAATLQMQRSSIGALSSTSFVYAYVGYDTGAGTGALYAVVGTISGTTITFGTPAFIRAGLSPQGVGCCALSSTSALVTYGDAGSTWAGTPLSISGTTITVGSQATTGTAASSGQCVALTSTTALCIDNYGNKARVVTVSGSTISWGSETTFGSGANYGCVTSASSTTAVVARVSGGGVGVVATALTISGTTITAGTPTTIDASAGNEPFGICAVTPTSVIAAYLNSSGYLKANGMTISGTTITVGTPSAPFTAYDANAINYDSGPIITATSSSQALVASINQSTGHGLGQFLNISGTTVTSSGTSTILAASTRAPTVAYLGSGKVIAGYGQGTTNISAKVLTLA